MTADPIGDALRADAEAARAEIRAAGIVCPSCGVNMADLDKNHVLTLTKGREYEDAPLRAPTAQCEYGRLIQLGDASFETMQAAANIALMDDFRKREAEVFGGYRGLLDTLGGPL